MPNGDKAGSRSADSERGFSLVVLIVAITLLSIGMMAALPLWSSMARREKEAEAVFRGLQYAEAIRVFKLRFGRYPNQLEELLELEPRSIRQLWTDPITDGEFGLLVEIAAPRGQGRQGRGSEAENPGDDGDDEERPRRGSSELRGGSDTQVEESGRGSGAVLLVRLPPAEGERRVRASGSIRGVYIEDEETPRRNYFEASSYRDWLFTDELILLPPVPEGDEILKRSNSDWIGLGFPADFQPSGVSQPPTAGEMPGSEREREARQRNEERSGDDQEGEEFDSFEDIED